jgi:hypothetical protein
MTNGIQTVSISHLGGSSIGYKFGRSYNPDLPTLVLSNSWSTSADFIGRSSTTEISTRTPTSSLSNRSGTVSPVCRRT